MTEQFILDFIPHRMKQLGYSKWHIRYREFVISGGNTPVVIPAYNDLYFLIEAGDDVTIESDYGIYNHNMAVMGTVPELTHQHRGEILMYNQASSAQRVKMIQVILVN